MHRDVFAVIYKVLLIALVSMITKQAWGVQKQPGSVQSAGVSFTMTNFSPTSGACAVETQDGECELLQDLDFDNPVFGLFYSRPGIQLFIGRGTQAAPTRPKNSQSEVAGGDLELLETVINVYGIATPFRQEERSPFQLLVPYGIHSGFRKVTSSGGSGSIDEFEATVIAVGLGAGVARDVGTTQFFLRLMPFFGLASRSLGFGNGTSAMLDGDIEVRFGPIKRRLGIAIGYQFRWQKWNMEEDFIADQDFEGTQHGFRIGVTW